MISPDHEGLPAHPPRRMTALEEVRLGAGFLSRKSMRLMKASAVQL